MPTSADKAPVRGHTKAVLDAYNEGKLDALDEYIALDVVRHSPPSSDIVGLEAYKKFIADLRTSYPDWHLTVDDWVRDGDFSASHGTCEGTLTGRSPTTGAEGTGAKVKFIYCSFNRWAGGKVVEEWVVNDFGTMLRQLGYTFVPPEPKK